MLRMNQVRIFKLEFFILTFQHHNILCYTYEDQTKCNRMYFRSRCCYFNCMKLYEETRFKEKIKSLGFTKMQYWNNVKMHSF